MPSRVYTSLFSTAYRFGQNGQEKSIELSGSGDSYTAEFWQFDSRIGKRWNIDPRPITAISPYATFSNNPLLYTDLLGDTSVVGAGGATSVNIDETQNQLNFYKPNTKYTLSGTNTSVPIQPGQLRSFTNILGTFRARWNTNEDGNVAFSGYKNDDGLTVQEATEKFKFLSNLNQWSTKNAFARFVNWTEGMNEESASNPTAFAVKLSLLHISLTATAASEPQVYSKGYNPSVIVSDGGAEFGFAYRAINPQFSQSTMQNGFYMSGAAGRLGNDGIYANSTIQGALKEFRFHNPGVNPALFEVKFPISKPLLINPPAGYFSQPLPFTQGFNILSAPSVRAPGTTNILIRSGAEVGKRIQ